MASNLDIPDFGVGASPGLNAPRMQAIWTFLKAIGSGGSGSVINSDKVAATTPSAVGLSMLSAADKAAQQALVSLPEVSDEGLVAHWSMDSVPEIPDDPAGVTYLQDAWATVDGWTADAGCSGVTVSGGKLFMQGSGAQLYIMAARPLTPLNGKTYKIKIDYDPAITFVQYSNGVSFVAMTLLKVGDYYIANSEVTSTTTTAFIQINYASAAIAGTKTPGIDFIYIGTGAYLPNSLIDNSGNGNHGTIYGATPVEGISGKALAFDGVNDYVLGNITTGNNDQTFSFWSKLNASKDLVEACLGTFNFNSGTAGNGISVGINTGAIRIQIGASGSYESLSISKTIDTALWHFYSAIFNYSARTVSVYQDGILVGTTAPFTANIRPFGDKFVMGYWTTDLSNGYPYNGTIDEPRIYNRALTAEEVYSLYMSKGRGPDAQVKSVRGVANSLVVRNASGYIEDAAPKPSAISGAIGQTTYITAGDNAQAVLPAGGTWEYIFMYVTTSNNYAMGDSMQRGVSAGGLGIAPASSGFKQTLLCWRIS